MNTIAEQIIAFNKSLRFTAELPDGIKVMNPFAENPSALEASSLFYRKYYADNNQRRIILGINPGRHGAGLTGVPFTDPKRLHDVCGIKCFSGRLAHEPSSVFVYDMIKEYGGTESFYGNFYINSISPLGFVAMNARGKEVNYNYYDSKALTLAAREFMLESLRAQLEFNIRRDVCFCLGTGKNYSFINSLNKEYKFFDKVIPLEHPRYVIQYKSKKSGEYVAKYINHFKSLS